MSEDKKTPVDPIQIPVSIEPPSTPVIIATLPAMPPPPPSKNRVIEVRTDPRILIPFVLIIIGIVVAAGLGKISVEMAGLLIGVLGMPSVFGVKTMPQLVQQIVSELQRQMASMPPPVLTSVVPPPPKVPTDTDAQPNLSEPPKETKP